jgi:DNA-binding response OmpR family regulator
MERSFPIIICDSKEEVRLLLRDMLTKHGFFHLLEVSSHQEVLKLIGKNDFFILIHKDLMTAEIKIQLKERSNFLIISQADDPETLSLASLYGVDHLISFPYSSENLVNRIRATAN